MAELFGTAPDGSPVRRVKLRADWGTASVITYGASLQDMRLSGVLHSLVLGSPDFAAYPEAMRFYGAIVGPVANRIAGGRFTLNGETYALDRNEPGATLHGGPDGLSQRNWDIVAEAPNSVTLAITHSDGLGGFPGPIDVRVTYVLTDGATLRITIHGEAARDCLFAPAFHGYWNLDGTADLSGHTLLIPADTYLPVDEAQIPTEVTPVDGTEFDYRKPRTPRADVDHNFCLGETRGAMRDHATLEADGLRMTIRSTEPGLQVYTAGGTDTTPHSGHGGLPYGRNAGIAMEPQVWPDAPNRSDFPSARLDANTPYEQVTEFHFLRTTA